MSDKPIPPGFKAMSDENIAAVNAAVQAAVDKAAAAKAPGSDKPEELKRFLRTMITGSPTEGVMAEKNADAVAKITEKFIANGRKVPESEQYKAPNIPTAPMPVPMPEQQPGGPAKK